jgi:hypothetical protein
MLFLAKSKIYGCFPEHTEIYVRQKKNFLPDLHATALHLPFAQTTPTRADLVPLK